MLVGFAELLLWKLCGNLDEKPSRVPCGPPCQATNVGLRPSASGRLVSVELSSVDRSRAAVVHEDWPITVSNSMGAWYETTTLPSAQPTQTWISTWKGNSCSCEAERHAVECAASSSGSRNIGVTSRPRKSKNITSYGCPFAHMNICNMGEPAWSTPNAVAPPRAPDGNKFAHVALPPNSAQE